MDFVFDPDFLAKINANMANNDKKFGEQQENNNTNQRNVIGLGPQSVNQNMRINSHFLFDYGADEDDEDDDEYDDEQTNSGRQQTDSMIK